MASSSVIAAFSARITANWAVVAPDTGKPCPFYTPNDRGTEPNDGTAFLSLEFPVSNTEQKSVGAPGAQVFREEGAARVVFNIPRGQGVDWWQQQLEVLLGHFRSTKFAGVITWAPTSPVLDDGNDSGNYWRLTAAIPYYADVIG